MLLDPILRKSAGPDYLGLWLDSKVGAEQTSIEILFAGDASDLMGSLPMEFRWVSPSINVRRATKDTAAYSSLASSIAQVLGSDKSWASVGALAQVHIDLLHERIVASIDPSHEGSQLARDILRARFSDTDVALVDYWAPLPAGNPTCGNGNLKCDWNWVYGGLHVGWTSGGICTSNIAVRYGPNLPAQLTAGHCLPSANTAAWTTGRAAQGSNYFNTSPIPGGDLIGWFVARASAFNGVNSHSTQLVYDAGLYFNDASAIRPGIGRVHIRDNQPAQVLAGVAGQVLNGTLCTSGALSTGMDGRRYEVFNPSPTRCGVVEQIATALDNYGQAWPWFTRTTIATQAGDSGGTIYAGGGPVYAVGIVSSVDVQAPFNPAGKCFNGSTWVTWFPGAHYSMPCRYTYTGPLSTVMVVWGLTFQAG